MKCLTQGHNTAPPVRFEPAARPCDQESDTLPTELTVLPMKQCVLTLLFAEMETVWLDCFLFSARLGHVHVSSFQVNEHVPGDIRSEKVEQPHHNDVLRRYHE